MRRKIALRSSAAGVAIGGFLPGGMWWAKGFLDGSVVLVAAMGIVWAATIASTLHVSQSYSYQGDTSPCEAVIGGSLLFDIVLALSGISISNDVCATLTVLAIGFTPLGYAAGMATVYRRARVSKLPDETIADG